MTRKWPVAVFIAGLLLVVWSLPMLIAMASEKSVGNHIMNRYNVEQAQKDGEWPIAMQSSTVKALGHKIEFVESHTGKTAPRTFHDEMEGVPPAEIVSVQTVIDGDKVSFPSEIWLSNREKGGRYFSWIEVLTVKDKETGDSEVAIVQRLTDDNDLGDNRKWRILHVKEDGAVSEETFTYAKRFKHELGVRIVTVSGTAMIAMGYRSDVLNVYPTLIFPLLYPWIAGIVGTLLFVFGGSALLLARKTSLYRS